MEVCLRMDDNAWRDEEPTSQQIDYIRIRRKQNASRCNSQKDR